MDGKALTIIAVVVGSLPIIFGALAFAVMYCPQVIPGILGTALGAWYIRAIVTVINRRSDPDRRPPDAP